MTKQLLQLTEGFEKLRVGLSEGVMDLRKTGLIYRGTHEEAYVSVIDEVCRDGQVESVAIHELMLNFTYDHPSTTLWDEEEGEEEVPDEAQRWEIGEQCAQDLAEEVIREELGINGDFTLSESEITNFNGWYGLGYQITVKLSSPLLVKFDDYTGAATLQN